MKMNFMFKRGVRKIISKLKFVFAKGVRMLALLKQLVKKMVKKILNPKIGVLCHHQPRPMVIPKHYANHQALSTVPTLSIVTPSLNQGMFLEATIKSIIDQNYSALEYIIQDGGSTDNSVEIIKRYQSRLKHWQSEKDQGQANAINLGFSQGTGEIMAYINSDDILLPGTLHYVVNYFNQHPDVDVIYGHRILIDENGGEIGRWVLPPHNAAVLSWADYVPQETLFWRRRIWEKTGAALDESFKFAMDWDLLLRFQDAGAHLVRLPRFLGAFRVHQNQKTSSQISDIGMKEMERLRIRCHGRKVTYVEIHKRTCFYLLNHVLLHKLYQIGVLKY